MWGTWTGRDGFEHPRRDLLYWHGKDGFHAIRVGDWKLFLSPEGAKIKTQADGPVLFNLAEDVAERTDVADKHPDKVQSMQALAKKQIADIRQGIIPLEK